MHTSTVSSPSIHPGQGVNLIFENEMVVFDFTERRINEILRQAVATYPCLQEELQKVHTFQHLPDEYDPLIQLCYLATIRQGAKKQPCTEKQAATVATHLRHYNRTMWGFKCLPLVLALLAAAAGYITFLSITKLDTKEQAAIMGTVIFVATLLAGIAGLIVTGTEPAGLAAANDDKQDQINALERNLNHLGAYLLELPQDLAVALAKAIDIPQILLAASENSGLTNEAAKRVFFELEAMVAYFREGKIPHDAKLSRTIHTHHLLEHLTKKVV